MFLERTSLYTRSSKKSFDLRAQIQTWRSYLIRR